MPSALRVEQRSAGRTTARLAMPARNLTDRAVIATDLSGKIVFWNRMAEEIYGWKWQEVMGRQITELVVPSSAQAEASTIMDQLRSGKSWSGEFKLQRRDGTEFVGRVTDHPMPDVNGNLIGIIGVSEPNDKTSGAPTA